MTLAQMAAIAASVKPQRAPAIHISTGISQRDILFQEESYALMKGLCPRCSAHVDVEVDPSRGVIFKCKRNPVWHEFQRSESFLRD